jgi:hypothetical protein
MATSVGTKLDTHFIFSSFGVKRNAPASAEPKLKKHLAKFSTLRYMWTCTPSALVTDFRDSCKENHRSNIIT